MQSREAKNLSQIQYGSIERNLKIIEARIRLCRGLLSLPGIACEPREYVFGTWNVGPQHISYVGQYPIRMNKDPTSDAEYQRMDFLRPIIR
jgi:hypothetical protein